jgi:hypothetical protein
MRAVRQTADPASLTAEETPEVGVEAYIFAYPLVLMELTRRQMTNLPVGRKPGFGPTGQFVHVREFPPAEFRAVVRPNFDTLYSVAWLDLTGEPMIVSAPDTDGRYYLLPMLDMWTDAFAVPGQRTTGTQAADYMVVAPGWQGEAPDGVEVIQAPTPHVWVIGRTQTNGPIDYEAVHAVQDGFVITPLSRWGQGPEPVEAHTDPSVDMKTDPLEQVNTMAARDFFGLAAELMKLHPPHVTDWSTVARMRRIGFDAGESFDWDALDDGVRQALESVPAQALSLMRATFPGMAKVVNGWQMNTDTMGVYGDFYMKRAIVAMMGLGANPVADAIYPINVADGDGEPLRGEHDYVMHFDADELPPVGAFWSVTMYDAEGYQVANELNRFAIGDRDDLAYGDDGSLDLYLQHESPGPDRASNWLPAPTGPLGVTMRLYAPAPEALDGRWNPPPITRTNSRADAGAPIRS